MAMTRALHQATAAVLFTLVAASAAEAQATLSPDQLADASAAVVVGRVESMAFGRDPITQGIYTYVSVAVSDVLAGAIAGSPIVLKQLGGRVEDEGAIVPGQARFVAGEEVLLYLALRPRDRSLYTTALWQGKWSVEPDAITGERMAVRRDSEGSTIDARSLSALRTELGGRPTPASIAGSLDVTPIETPRDTLPFVLNDPLIRWMTPVVAVRTSAGGQPGLNGGGAAEIAAALAQWNAAGSGLTLAAGGPTQAAPCIAEPNVIRIKFNDPCGEIGDPATLAYSTYRYNFSPAQNVGGRVYLPITRAEVVTSANPDWRWALILPACFQSTIAHELGHALGFQHSADPSALMYRDRICNQDVRPLAPDDVAAMLAVYPRAADGAGAPGSATVMSATATAGLLNISWTLGAGVPPTANRLEFFSAGVPVASVTTGRSTTAAIPIPPGTTGSFAVRVTALNGSTAGGSSPLFPFTIGGAGGGACTSPPVSPAVMGNLARGTASVNWSAVPGATSYIISAGTTQGSTNLLPPTNLGMQMATGATGLPNGFAAWVRVIAVNACGQSRPMDLHLIDEGE